ncbi:MAG: pilus assembly PilX N-terminal domain-containing protein [Planctomycetota bacterium]|nr:pilus assembly PilX N-terminal domain-containing protein [Planctomycetota bacterium]
MRLRGSVLIVILGLLGVLAVVGIAFVTMSSIESNTAANFALQAQFDLAADGAVDYVCHALVRDVWEFDPAQRLYTGYLLTGKFGTFHWDWPDPTKPTTASTPTKPWPDAFLATNWSTNTAPATPAYSFRTDVSMGTVKPFNLITWAGTTGALTIGSATLDGSPNNLGIPKTGATVLWYDPPNGLWIPELAHPFGSGVVRTSVTVVDHAGMVNLNAHGTPGTAATGHGWIYSKASGKGYFVCDVSPDSLFSTALATGKLLYSTAATSPPGRWSITNNAPGNARLGEIFFQNPTIAQDRPFTLDDEFELRRPTGTYAKSRLESLCGSGLTRTPADTSTATLNVRLGLTTVGWNAEVMPGQSTVGGVVPTKTDLNLAIDPSAVAGTLDMGGAVKKTLLPNYVGQFAANVHAFKSRYIKPATVGGNYFKAYGNYYGARRQAIMTKVKVTQASSGTWQVKVQLYNPWYGNYAGDTQSSIDVTGHSIKIYMSGGTTAVSVLPITSIAYKTTWNSGDVNANGTGIDKVTLEATGPGIIDQITGADIGSVGSSGSTKKRPIGVYDEPRASDDTDASCVVTVLYVKNWVTGTDVWDTKPDGGDTGVAKGAGIPIRFPHSVPPNDAVAPNRWDAKVDGPLPPYYNALDTAATGKPKAFKAFLRVGDLNQVLCPRDETEATSPNYWPWIAKVAIQSSLCTGDAASDKEFEKFVKWDWWKDTTAIDRTRFVYDSPTPPTQINPANVQYKQFNAANIFCVDSPWLDSYDNDGDGKKDDVETADTKALGRFCGKEIRVAGRINLNTATDQALKALGLGLTGDASAYLNIATARPLTSPVEVLRTLTTPKEDPECFGALEKRDFWYTRISNIATVRSDTFSIYGTVQFGPPF